LVVRTQPHEVLRGRIPADYNYMDPIGKGREGGMDDFMEFRTGRYLLIVVQDDDERGFEPPVELFEVPECENGDSKDVFGSKQRQRFGESRRSLLGSKSHVIEKRGDIRVPGVDSVPEMPESSSIQITAYEARLARTGRTGNP
jgi:hypothetical protein